MRVLLCHISTLICQFASQASLHFSIQKLANLTSERAHREEVVENLGSILYGERIERSNYVIRLLVSEQCRVLECENEDGTPVSYSSMTAADTNRMLDLINQGYYANWILDNLPSASTKSTDEVMEFGFPLGRADTNSQGTQAVLYNHFSITVQYNHNKKDDTKHARVVFFEVVPHSIDWASMDTKPVRKPCSARFQFCFCVIEFHYDRAVELHFGRPKLLG